MTRPLDDRALDALLEDLDRPPVGDDFARGVFHRLERRRTRTRALRQLGAAVAAVAVAIAGWWSLDARRHQQAAQQEMAALRAEILALRQELVSLERTADAGRPVLYLGSTDEVDLVLDLQRLARADRAWRERAPTDARAASWPAGAHLREPTRTTYRGDTF